MAAAEELRLEFDAGADVEGTDAFGGVHFMAAEGVEVDAESGEIQGEAAGDLDAVGVEEGSSVMGEGGKFGDRLEGAELVVGVHDGDEAGLWAEGGLQGGGGYQTVRVRLQDGEVGVTGERLGDGGMFERGGDDVAVGAGEGEVVGFSSAAREDDFFGRAAEAGGELAAGGFEELFGALAMLMDAGGVAVGFRQHWNECGEDVGGDWGGRVMVEVGHS